MPGETHTLMLCGDVMTGRGIDQILPHPNRPVLYERYMTSALDYVRLAEEANGPMVRPVTFPYIWGDALPVLDHIAPDLRIINLETSVTEHAEPEPKGINYRMHPENVGCLTAASIDCCVIANNHVLDWGREGLAETLATLGAAHMSVAGAGRDQRAAEAPAILPTSGDKRVLVYGIGCPSSGVPSDWAASDDRSGVAFLEGPSAKSAGAVAARIRRDRRSDDIVVVSIHWDANWGYNVNDNDRDFAHALIDAGAADIIHGHSSHHPKVIEVYRGRPIFYGCGDLINDYEGIAGHEAYRSDLSLMYFVSVDDDQRLVSLEMAPFRMSNFRLNRADDQDRDWLRRLMDRECRRFGGRIEPTMNNMLRWVPC